MTNVTAIQPANAIAEWPLGQPPRSGVPSRPLTTLSAITPSSVSTSAMNVTCTGVSRTCCRKSRDGSPIAGANTR